MNYLQCQSLDPFTVFFFAKLEVDRMNFKIGSLSTSLLLENMHIRITFYLSYYRYIYSSDFK